MTYNSHQIRNVVLLGHSGSGKTSFAEAMLFEAKSIPRRGRVEDQTTISDFSPVEQQRRNSIFSTLMHASWKDCKINILDTPGFDDFVGEVVSSLKVADTALMLLNAKSGVEVGTELIWEYIENFKTPTIFIINQLDHEKADYEMTLEQARERFGNKVLPVQYPMKAGDDFHVIIDALKMIAYVFPKDGGRPTKEAIPASERARAEAYHQQLVEAAAENDETLMELFFENGTLTEEELAKGLTMALAKQEFYPVFCASAIKNMGSGRIMGFLHDIAPAPAQRPEMPLQNGGTLACDSEGQTVIFIYKTLSEPNVGNVSYFKVCAGTLHRGEDLVNSQNATVERFNQIYVANGKNREPIAELKAGDIGVTLKLKNAHSNNTLTAKGLDAVIEPIAFPASRMRMAITAPDKKDIEKLAVALHQLQEEDPTLRLEQSAELKQTLLHAQGQLHLDIVKYRIEKMYNIVPTFLKPRIPYRETITRAANEAYRHKKQSGGAGQFAEVHLRIEPYTEGMPNPEGLVVRNTETDDLAWGGQLIFCNCIVGGSIDAKFMSAIKKGVMGKMQEGPLTGSHVRDIRVSVYDGKMHPVDSNDMAFQLAGAMAFKNAFQKAGAQLLEPIYDIEVLCAPEVMGDVMGDLQTRRAIIMGMDTEGHYQKVKARVPLAELHHYSTALRSLTQGKAKFLSQFADYAAVPSDVQHQLLAEQVQEGELEHAH
jgi:elongation factor G